MSDVQSPLPLLVVNNVELANAARVMGYLSAGLAASRSGSFEVATEYPCTLLYRIAGLTTFVSPAADPAPWYVLGLDESADFLGFIITDWSGFDDSTVGRSAQARLGGIEGAQLGPQRQVPRVQVIRGFLVAASPEGNEYGLRWLTSQLAANDCDACATGTLQLWTSCPPDDSSNDDFGRRVIYDVGLTDGPRRLGTVIAERSCDIQEIEFTLVAENPYLYRAPTECLTAEILGASIACGDIEAPDICTWLFGPAGDPHCCTITGSSYGTVGTVITIDSPDGIGGITIALYASCDETGPVGDPVRELEIERVDVGCILTIDSAQKKIVLTNADGTQTDGTHLLMLPVDETFDWIEVANCEGEPLCVCARTSHPCSGGASTTVAITTQVRER